MQAQDVVVVGRIGAPYGVQGWVRVSSFTEPPANLIAYEPWLLETDGTWRALHPTGIKSHKQGYVVRFDGVENREQAGRMTGRYVAVARAQLPQLAPDEYYWRDLEGLAVWNRGVRIGLVDHMMETGANPVLVVRSHEHAETGPAASGTETLIPFVAQFVLEVDLDAGRIEVSWDGAE